MSRHGSAIGVKGEELEAQKKLHAAVWPEVLEQIRRSNIRDYSICPQKVPDGQFYLFDERGRESFQRFVP